MDNTDETPVTEAPERATADKSKLEQYDEAHGPLSDDRTSDVHGERLDGTLDTTAAPPGSGPTADGRTADRPIRAEETEDDRLRQGREGRSVEPNAEPDAATDQPTRGNLHEADNVGKAKSAAPPRPHDQLVSQLAMYWAELQAFASSIKGDVDGHLGDLLTFVRERS